jgi:nicotinate-nucleotide pyrophosphorylase (carboxylating)
VSLLGIALDELVDRALREDLASGDLTSESCIDAYARASADAVAREPLVVCGGDVFARAFERLDATTKVERRRADGEQVAAGEVIWSVEGLARSVLSAERVALNYVQRMCGIATMAATYVAELAPGSTTRITDTRKTTPGLRLLERYAVRTGGAHNHRDNLGAAVMIKDNHIVASGSIATAVARARARAPHTARIEVEVTGLPELEQAIAAGADIIMLDNMDDVQVKAAIARVADLRPRPLLEASGRITLPRVRALSAMGVDIISVGALTHSAKAADIGLDFKLT